MLKAQKVTEKGLVPEDFKYKLPGSNKLNKAKYIALIVMVDMFILIVVSACLSLLYLLTRVLFPLHPDFLRIMSVSFAVTVLASLAFYLVFDLCECLFSGGKDTEDEG